MSYRVPRCAECGEILDEDNVSLKRSDVCVMCEETDGDEAAR